jgi:hypothetical protein
VLVIATAISFALCTERGVEHRVMISHADLHDVRLTAVGLTLILDFVHLAYF